MKTIYRTCLLSLTVALCWPVQAQIYETNGVVVQTLAGSGVSGYLDGQGTQTMFYNPQSPVADSKGNIFVLESESIIRRITSEGTVSTYAAGRLAWLGIPKPGTNVAYLPLDGMRSIIIDRSDRLWMTSVQSIFGGEYWLTLSRLETDGRISSTNLYNLLTETWPTGVCVASNNDFYYPSLFRIYRWRANGGFELFVGSGNVRSIDGNGVFTAFSQPRALAADAVDNIFVLDVANGNDVLIRRINQNRDVVTIAGKARELAVNTNADGVGADASFNVVSGMTVDEVGNLILACGTCIRKITPTGIVTTVAGNFSRSGYADGPGPNALFNNASGVCVSHGAMFVADTGNHRIRKISFNSMPSPVSSSSLKLALYPGLEITAGLL